MHKIRTEVLYCLGTQMNLVCRCVMYGKEGLRSIKILRLLARHNNRFLTDCFCYRFESNVKHEN